MISVFGYYVSSRRIIIMSRRIASNEISYRVRAVFLFNSRGKVLKYERLVLTSSPPFQICHRVVNKMVDLLVHLFAIHLNKTVFIDASMSALLDLAKKMHKKNAALLEKLDSLSSMLI